MRISQAILTLLPALTMAAAPAAAEMIEIEEHETWGGGGAAAMAGWGAGHILGQSPSSLTVTGLGYGFGYALPNLRVGGWGTGGVAFEKLDGDPWIVSWGGGGPMVGYELRFARFLSVDFDLGLGFGYAGGRHEFEDATATGIGSADPDDVDVIEEVGSFGMGYMASIQFDVRVVEWMRIGLRVQSLYVTDYGVNDVSLFNPAGGLAFTFGNFPGAD